MAQIMSHLTELLNQLYQSLDDKQTKAVRWLRDVSLEHLDPSAWKIRDPSTEYVPVFAEVMTFTGYFYIFSLSALLCQLHIFWKIEFRIC